MREGDALEATFERQRSAFRANPHPPASERRAHLAALGRLLVDHAEAIANAVSADFGHRSPHETRFLEIFPALEEARHARRHLARWMQPEPADVSIWFQPGTAEILKQPLGVVGIIAPWNYPVLLAVAPLVSALAAGNRVMLKMSELTPQTGDLLARLIATVFSDDRVTVFNGGIDLARAFSALPFDHLLFTGSTAVGRHVMTAAAANLTPVTLELGGKSPALVAPGYPVDRAARRIIWGKCLNAGQTCIAPDYVLVPASTLATFVDAARDEVRRLYPAGAAAADYSAIISDVHYRRLTAWADEARQQGAELIPLAEGGSDALRKMPPVILTRVEDGMRVMQEEIFGPLLPVRTYAHVEEALAYIRARPRPLALYYFDNDRARTRRVLDETAAGGVTVNDTILHIGQVNLPFGGVGASGMGAYHGEAGFTTFSKRTGVFVQSRWSALSAAKAPYGRLAEWLLR
jgi:coniferyl-aldehyde dehydrogenase